MFYVFSFVAYLAGPRKVGGKDSRKMTGEGGKREGRGLGRRKEIGKGTGEKEERKSEALVPFALLFPSLPLTEGQTPRLCHSLILSIERTSNDSTLSQVITCTPKSTTKEMVQRLES